VIQPEEARKLLEVEIVVAFVSSLATLESNPFDFSILLFGVPDRNLATVLSLETRLQRRPLVRAHALAHIYVDNDGHPIYRSRPSENERHGRNKAREGTTGSRRFWRSSPRRRNLLEQKLSRWGQVLPFG